MNEGQGSWVAGGIVTFNPDMDLLKDNIESVLRILNCLWIVDNGSENVTEIKKLLDHWKNDQGVCIELIELKENLGIAAALNRMMMLGKENGYRWVLTLDQDSKVPENIIHANKEALSREDIGIISAIIQDRNILHQSPKMDKKKFSQIDKCITSASLTSVYAWEKVGKFDEDMFIDEVDHEFCVRLTRSGYKILRNNEVVFSHAIGNAREVKFLGKWVAVQNHSAFRKYYQTRNSLYMSKKLYGKITLGACKRVCSIYVKVVLYEKHKMKKLVQLTKGVIDGLRMMPNNKQT